MGSYSIQGPCNPNQKCVRSKIEKEPPGLECRPTCSDCRRRLAAVELRAGYGSNAGDCGHSAEARQLALSAKSGSSNSAPNFLLTGHLHSDRLDRLVTDSAEGPDHRSPSLS
jgi:hypothetical protein